MVNITREGIDAMTVSALLEKGEYCEVEMDREIAGEERKRPMRVIVFQDEVGAHGVATPESFDMGKYKQVEAPSLESMRKVQEIDEIMFPRRTRR